MYARTSPRLKLYYLFMNTKTKKGSENTNALTVHMCIVYIYCRQQQQQQVRIRTFIAGKKTRSLMIKPKNYCL